MTALRPDLVRRDEEPKLAAYLVAQVMGRASGALEAECTHNAPHDQYFIGSIRPAPPKDEDTGRPAFMDELMSKLAPVAFGAEFGLHQEGDEIVVDLRLDWSCYYRVFPSLIEQRTHQRFRATAGAAEQEAAEDLDEPADLNGEEAPAEDEEDEGGQPPPGSFVGDRRSGRRRNQAADVLFPKYRKIRCSAVGPVVLKKDSSGVWTPDTTGIQTAIEREMVRARGIVTADSDHLRLGPNLEKIKVPEAALESAASYAAFLRQYPNSIIPDWQWSIAASSRADDDVADLVMVLEATNTSTIDSRAWQSEGFFFDVKASFAFRGAAVVPFGLELAPRGFRYDRLLWGRGFNCEVIRGTAPYEFETTNAPVFSQPRYSTNTTPTASFKDLSTDPVPVLERIAAAMHEYEREWRHQRDEYGARDPAWVPRHGVEYERDFEAFQKEIARFEAGVRLIATDEDVRLAFRLTNEAFRLGDKSDWRLFQVVFIVSQIPGICAVRGGTVEGPDERAAVDIIYFPTGGGKTEAYLGVAVFHCFFDRLRGKTAGVTTWTRFPLRLLTLQQTQRVADVIGAAEVVRRSQADRRLSGPGIDGFAVGYFVGREATPNELTPPRPGSTPDADWSIATDPAERQRWKRIVRCPVCRTATVSVDFDEALIRLQHRCSNPGCRLPGGIIPVYVIDNEIYRYLPAVVVGTIDKLAGLGNQRKMSLVLGQVTGRCAQHGYYNAKCCQKNCKDQQRLVAGRPAGMSGPTLFVQDELHLLKEGLGTFDGHYETFLQALMTTLGEAEPVKIIASSATIEAFDRQVEHLYGRKARVFPGLGPTLRHSFYAQTFEYPQRLFVGVLPHNKTILNAVLELFQYYHEILATLERLPLTAGNPYGGAVSPGTEEWHTLLDPYLTSLGYFSSLREMNPIRTDLETHVHTLLENAGLPGLRIAELSSSTTSDRVTRILESLEGKQRAADAPTTILATSMVSHGVDVDRLNLMLFYGMPKSNAEYIQASSRVGRSHVGIVLACLKPARERDQSHFAYFGKYHEFLGQLVEPVAINRWSKFSIQRTIPGLFMAVLLQRIANSSGERDPNRFYFVEFAKKQISEGKLRAQDFTDLLERAYLIQGQDAVGPTAFREEIGRRIPQFLDQILGAGAQAMFVSDALAPAPMRSLRDVDEQVPVELDPNGSAWATRTGQ